MSVLQVLPGIEAASLYQLWRFYGDVSPVVQIAPWPKTERFEGLQECQSEAAMFHKVRTVRQLISHHLVRLTLDY